MYLLSFVFSAVSFIFLTLFVFFNYPVSWRKNKLFVTVLIIWHVLGVTSMCAVFTIFRYIPYEGIKAELVRIGTFHYITITLLVFLFLFRLFFSQSCLYVRKQTGKKVSGKAERFLTDRRVHSVVFLLLSFGICTMGYFQIDFLRETDYEVVLQKTSEEKELSICLIADIHAGAGNWDFLYDDLIERIDACEADVLLIGGDVFDETSSDRDVARVTRVLKTIRRPKYGIYYIYGNHDNAIDDWAGQQMRSMGVTVLEDEMAILGKDIQLIGRMDPKHRHQEFQELTQQLSVDWDKPVLVLTHRPADFKEMGQLGCDLAMAGHTHGFNIPQFLGANMLGDMYYGSKQYGEMTAITTSGVSAWGFHYKWPAVSEVVRIHVSFAAPGA